VRLDSKESMNYLYAIINKDNQYFKKQNYYKVKWTNNIQHCRIYMFQKTAQAVCNKLKNILDLDNLSVVKLNITIEKI